MVSQCALAFGVGIRETESMSGTMQDQPDFIQDGLLKGPPRTPVKSGRALTRRYSRGKSRIRPITRRQAIDIASQLSVMLDTGIPLADALETLAGQSDKPDLRDALGFIHQRIRGGGDLSTAVSACPHRFPRVFWYLLRASEASGTMGEMLERVAEYLGDEQETVRKVRSALIYPAVMLGMAVATLILMVTFLLPRFGVIYKGREEVLPALTRTTFALSDLVLANWIIMCVALIGLAVGGVMYFRSAGGRRTADWLKLNAPFFGKMFRQFYVARSVRTIGSLVASGLTIPDSVKLAQDITGNSYFADLWSQADESLQAGGHLSDPLFACRLVANNVAQMVATGEKTGRLAQVMERTARFCESELRITIKDVTTLLEPLLIAIMAVFIGILMGAMLLPIFTISKLLTS